MSRENHNPPFGILRTRSAGQGGKSETKQQQTENLITLDAAFRKTMLNLAGDELSDMLRNIEETRKRLEHPRSAVRRAALYLLVDYWQVHDERTASQICRMRNDSDLEIRQDSVGYLGNLFRHSKDPEIAQMLAQIVANEAEPTSLRRTAYIALLRVMRLNILRHGPPPAIEIREQVDWQLIRSCLRREEFSSSDDNDVPIMDQLDRIASILEPIAKANEAFDEGDYATAVSRYSECLKQDSNSRTLYMRGCAYGNQGDIDAAIADFSAAIALEPTEPVYFQERSEAYRRKGMLELAQTDKRTAADLERSHSKERPSQ